jgi:hypothetical protein
LQGDLRWRSKFVAGRVYHIAADIDTGSILGATKLTVDKKSVLRIEHPASLNEG